MLKTRYLFRTVPVSFYTVNVNVWGGSSTPDIKALAATATLRYNATSHN